MLYIISVIPSFTAVLCSLLYTGRAQDAVLTIEPSWLTFFAGEFVTFICDMREGRNDDWEYKIIKDSWDLGSYDTHQSYTLYPLQTYHTGEYQCRGRRKSSNVTKDSNIVSLTVSAYKPKPRLVQISKTTPVGGSVTLSCSVENSAGWKYDWFRRTSNTNEVQVRANDVNGFIGVSQGGIYRCIGSRGEPTFDTDISDQVICEITFTNKVVVIQQPNWPQIFRGETITLTCEVQGGETTEWGYEWRRSGSDTPWKHEKTWTFTASESSSGDYTCKTRRRDDPYSSTETSEALRLLISDEPKTQLRADTRLIPVGGRVTLSCSVNPSSSGWRYYWYRDEESSEPLTSPDAVFQSDGQISVSQGGIYWCRGGRGEPVYYTTFSDPVNIYGAAPNRAVVTLHPNWPQIYRGEKITLRCEIHGGNTEWEYEWTTSSSNKPPNLNEFTIPVYSSNAGTYKCKGRMKSKNISTDWSDSFSLTISKTSIPVLSVSPSWLSPGVSVTLSCEVKHPSAGWSFYWYKALPQLPNLSYIYELLPGSTSGTAQDSYIIDGQTHTAGYACRAGRGDPVIYTHYSQTKMVWSADPHPSASLTVSPDRVQHFSSDSVSLTCEGNSTEWRVRLTLNNYTSTCSYWGTMIGSTCVINRLQHRNTVFWCESGSAFSNAVNITGQNNDGIILVNPVHPVTEGASVSLSCRLRRQNLLSSVFFYHNDKLIPNDGRGELNISAVSQSHEGFYKCEHSGNVSTQSWMAVKSVSRTESSSFLFLVWLLVPVILLSFLLLLLCLYKKSKDSCCIRLVHLCFILTINHQFFSFLCSINCIYCV
ncbi:B-cell receptor CD22-like [Cololabis saira]|uniref:B-cell receptor CD22-like n=1 Tax=Cololabis saira TaxID=129043 RepID=UPI002AD44FE2|nr:B-cell receptor CD22-like [Cololabis saira]